MEKVYSNLFLETPTKKKSFIKNVKLRLCFFFILGFFNNFYVFLKGGLGFKFYIFVIRKSVSSFLKRRINIIELCEFVTSPLDSFRYFEFHYADSFTKDLHVESYLDISSPRYFPAYFLENKQNSKAYLLNPDKKDMHTTKEIYKKFSIQGNCTYISDLIEDCDLPLESFDLITSISVLEHIPLEAIDKGLDKLVALLKTGGYLLISVPVSATPFEEYINWNEYGLQNESNNGYYFGQRFHDQKMLESLFHSRFGQPLKMKIIGEKINGYFINNRFEKINYSDYPHWKESSLFFNNYQEYNSLNDMPGLGVSIFLYRK